MELENNDVEELMGDPNYYKTPLHLFTASAGSGKTYRLAFEYISLLLKADCDAETGKEYPFRNDNYRHILAITFTRKATAEMKSRILTFLHILGEGKGDAEFAKNLATRLNLPDKEVQARAYSVYHHLLHDYTSFHIDTIDSFFQTVLKNLAKEVGIGTGWNIDLDTDGLLESTTEEIYSQISSNSEIKHWLENESLEQIKDGKSWDVKKAINDFGKNIFREDFQTNEAMQKYLNQPDLKNTLKQLKDNLQAYLSQKIKEFIPTQAELDLAENNLKSNAVSLVCLQNSYRDKDNFKFNAKVLKDLKPIKAIEGNPELLELFTRKMEEARNILFFRAIKDKITYVGLLGDMYTVSQQICDRKGTFMLANTQSLLSKFLEKEGDAPFLFEKVGQNIEYIMIDEFQDTSKTQYDNFRPLLNNCCGSHYGSLLVGDAKQSIYRFRNGDWHLIGNLQEQKKLTRSDGSNDLATTPITVHRLDSNYRSGQRVIDFNNRMFTVGAADSLIGCYQSMDKSLATDAHSLQIIYKGNQQKVGKDINQGQGYVKVRLKNLKGEDKKSKEKEDEPLSKEDWMAAAVKAEMDNLVNNGVRYEDICILVSKNDQMNTLAAYLQKMGIEAGTSKAYLLSKSSSLKKVVAALFYLNDLYDESKNSRKNRNFHEKMLLDSLVKSEAVPDADGTILLSDLEREENKKILDQLDSHLLIMPLYDRVEAVISIVNQGAPTDIYQHTFLDKIRQYITNYDCDLTQLLDYWTNSLKDMAIEVVDGQKGKVRMMTIHASKGLESQSVIVAFCDDILPKASSKNNHAVSWMKNATADGGELNKDIAGLKDLPLIPIALTAALDSPFQDQVLKEYTECEIDTFNKYYVAFTRAGQNLTVLSAYKEPKTGHSISFYDCLKQALQKDLKENETDATEMDYEAGSIVPSSSPKETSRESTPTPNVDADAKTSVNEPIFIDVTAPDTFNFKAKFRASSDALKFVRGKDFSKAADGTLLHSVFKYIWSIKDFEHPEAEIERSVAQLVKRGEVLIRENGGTETGTAAVTPSTPLADISLDDVSLCQLMEEVFAQLKGVNRDCVKAWFSAANTVINEKPILSESDYKEADSDNLKLETKIPDRIICDAAKKHFIVIDYKTGGFNPTKSYRGKLYSAQVNHYMNLILQLMPGCEVKGFLWYVNVLDEKNQIVPVEWVKE